MLIRSVPPTLGAERRPTTGWQGKIVGRAKKPADADELGRTLIGANPRLCGLLTNQARAIRAEVIREKKTRGGGGRV